MKSPRRTSILSVLAGTGLFLAVTGCTADADPQMEVEQGAVSLATKGSDQVSAEDARPGHRQPRPTLHVRGQFAYVSEPATQELHVVDLADQSVIDSAALPVVPNELSSVTG